MVVAFILARVSNVGAACFLARVLALGSATLPARVLLLVVAHSMDRASQMVFA